MTVPELCDELVAAGYKRSEIIIQKNMVNLKFTLVVRGPVKWKSHDDFQKFLIGGQEPLFMHVLRRTGTLGSWNAMEQADLMVDEIKAAQVMAKLKRCK